MGNQQFPNCPNCTDRFLCNAHAQQLTNQFLAAQYNADAKAYQAKQRRRSGGWCSWLVVVGVLALTLDVWLAVDVFL